MKHKNRAQKFAIRNDEVEILLMKRLNYKNSQNFYLRIERRIVKIGTKRRSARLERRNVTRRRRRKKRPKRSRRRRRSSPAMRRKKAKLTRTPAIG